MARPEKVAVVEEIRERFESADAALLTEYRGLGVGDIAEVRNALREVGSEYKVLKNTLARIAARESGMDELVGMLEGPTAIAFIHGDAAAAAKALDTVAKKFPVLVIKGGMLKGGKVIDADQAKQLASLEPREVQLAKIAMMMNQPVQLTVNVFAALLRDLGSMLAQVVEKKTSGELPGGMGEAPSEPVAEAPAEASAEPVAEEMPAAEAAVRAEEQTETTDAPAPETEEGAEGDVEAPAVEAAAAVEEQSGTTESEETAGGGDQEEEA